MNTLKCMKVESVREDKDRIVIITTGAKYIIHKTPVKGRIDCYQVLNEERFIAGIDFDMPFERISIERSDESTCVLNLIPYELDCRYLRIQINRDSLIDIYSVFELKLTFTGDFLPEYYAEKDGNTLLIDQIGGIGIYPYRELRVKELVNCNNKYWKISHKLNEHARVLVSVFPPRKFNYLQSFEDRIYHRSYIADGSNCMAQYPFPSDKEIEEAHKYTSIMVLPDTAWQGKLTRRGFDAATRETVYADGACSCFDYIAINEEELVRTVKKAHSLGMKVMPYMSAFYSSARGNDFLSRIKETLNRYDLDGVYFDGVPQDIIEAYEIVRKTREILGDKLLYIHCTKKPVNHNVFCPFIDTYADYILRAEGVDYFKADGIENYAQIYLRYVISGFNISNTIGNVCYASYGGYPLDLLEELIDKSFEYKARFYLGAFEGEMENLIKNKYFKELDKLYREYKILQDIVLNQ